MKAEVCRTDDELAEFCAFPDAVYASRETRWPANVAMQVSTFRGDVPMGRGRTFHPIVVRDGGDVVARACAVVDRHYLDHWDDGVGHVAMFEALPHTREAVRALSDACCEWLASQGMSAARAGFGGGTEFPFALEDDGALPPSPLRHNPSYYHSLLKDAGFETERGWVDYKAAVTPELLERYSSEVRAAGLNGFRLATLAEVDEAVRVDHFLATWNESFKAHWAMTPFARDELDLFMQFLGPGGMLDLSVIAYDGDDPVGVLWVLPESTEGAVAARPLRDDERLNFLGIGVLERARGRGVNTAMASKSYLALAARGATHLSYTLVLDDNWPSRRTAEKLGAHVCGNYLTYRRNFRPRS